MQMIENLHSNVLLASFLAGMFICIKYTVWFIQPVDITMFKQHGALSINTAKSVKLLNGTQNVSRASDLSNQKV
jgi:hypothetical protein